MRFTFDPSHQVLKLTFIFKLPFLTNHNLNIIKRQFFTLFGHGVTSLITLVPHLVVIDVSFSDEPQRFFSMSIVESLIVFFIQIACGRLNSSLP
jgi:hypothetical protein